MTFEEFQTTRQHCTDLGAKLSDSMWDNEPKGIGNIYVKCLYIEHIQPHWPDSAKSRGQWHLILGRDEWISNDLSMLERKLYEFAVSEGLVS